MTQRMKAVSRMVMGGGAIVVMALLALIVLPLERVMAPKPFEAVKSSYQQSEALLLDRNGEILHELRVDAKGRRLEWATIDDISPALIQAVLFVEDKRFFRHRGVDWAALGSSALRNAWGGHARGASTITMQLAAVLDKRLKARHARRSVAEKWRQMRAAWALEKGWTKEQILEAYLNLVTFRGELQGIRAVSKGLFDKAPSGLDSAESLVLASLITSPNARPETVTARAALLYRGAKGEAMPPEARERMRDMLGAPYLIRPNRALAPHVAQMLLAEKRGKVWCTIDARLQSFVLESLNHHLTLLRQSNVSDGAVLVADNRTGEILAYVGNSGRSSSAYYVDGIEAPRQAGSTLKPFLYGLAVEKRLLTAASILEDSPVHVSTPTGLYVPRNYDNIFRGRVTLRTALSSSLNVPAVRTLLVVGVTPFLNHLRNLGFASLTEEAEYYGYSIALGSADITLWELVNAYRTLANSGRWGAMSLTGRTTGIRQVMDEGASYIISSILSDREARSETFGLENPLSTRFWTAVKTGTSKDMRDNWCVGYSGRYTVGVWVGNFSGESMQNVSGVSGAAPVWTEIMNYLHAKTPSRPPRPPSNIAVATVTFDERDIGQKRQEFFIAGTEPVSIVTSDAGHGRASITYPSNDTLIAIDPDIPRELQLVPMRFEGTGAKCEWVIDGARTGVSGLLLWSPQPGTHEAAIIDGSNRIVDSVSFVVR